jgi:hypothetical protein
MNYPKPDTLNGRLAENRKAPLRVRLKALQSIERPSMALLYRLTHAPDTPAKLYAVAASLYEVAHLRKELRTRAKQQKNRILTNNN